MTIVKIYVGIFNLSLEIKIIFSKCSQKIKVLNSLIVLIINYCINLECITLKYYANENRKLMQNLKI